MKILVVPKNEDMVRVLRHPDKSVSPFVDVDTPREWPSDQFTTRRIEQGDVIKIGDVPIEKTTLRRLGPPRFPAKRK
jgi:hypothetical protein